MVRIPFATIAEYQPQCGWDPHPNQPTLPALGLPTPVVERKSANDLTSQNVRKATNAYSPTYAGTETAWEATQAKDAPNKTELKQVHTPLRHSQFERELAHHPNKSFMSRVLTHSMMGWTSDTRDLAVPRMRRIFNLHHCTQT
jgi:hypothetical protein